MVSHKNITKEKEQEEEGKDKPSKADVGSHCDNESGDCSSNNNNKSGDCSSSNNNNKKENHKEVDNGSSDVLKTDNNKIAEKAQVPVKRKLEDDVSDQPTKITKPEDEE